MEHVSVASRHRRNQRGPVLGCVKVNVPGEAIATLAAAVFHSVDANVNDHLSCGGPGWSLHMAHVALQRGNLHQP